MAPDVPDWLALIRAEYIEIPGLHLTKPQVQRLWGLDTMTCDALLEALVDARFLRRTHTGAYARLDGARQSRQVASSGGDFVGAVANVYTDS